RGGGLEDRNGRREAAAPIQRARKDYVRAVGPDDVQGAVAADRSGEPLHAAVVVARQAALGADAQRAGPREAVIGGARQQDLRAVERELGPTDVEVPRQRAAAVVGHDVGL